MTKELSVEQAGERNKAVLGGVGNEHAAIEILLTGYLASLLNTYPTSERRLARIEASIALVRAAANLLTVAGHVMNDDRTGTELQDAMPRVGKVLVEAQSRVDRYIEAKRGDLTDQAFEHVELMADVVKERFENEEKNALLDAQSKALGEAMDRGLNVISVVGDTMIASKHPLTESKVLVS